MIISQEEYYAMHGIVTEDDYLAHYGILRKSGRYPWGSGENPEQRSRDFLSTISALRKEGMSDTDIAKSFSSDEQPFTTADLRRMTAIAGAQKKMADIAQAQRLKDKGLSNVAIGERMGIRESSVRGLLAPGAADKADILRATTEMLKREVEEKGFLDVGSKTGAQLGISDTKLKDALYALQESGYKIHYQKVRTSLGNETSLKILTKDTVTGKEVYAAVHSDKVRLIQEHSEDGGRGFLGIQPPINIESSRIGINYKEDGGSKSDGVIFVRPGAKDLDMGGNQYAQVRIAVDGTHYLKGMAVLKNDLPPGTDLVFNTNKSSTGNKLDAMKPLKQVKRGEKEGQIDEDNPFGAVVRQLPKIGADGLPIKGTVRSAINLVNTDEDWDKWSRSLSTQFLSKQSPVLAKTQLDMTYERKKNELDAINALTNPEVKKRLLQSFADGADSSAVVLKAAALPGQRAQVIMPVPSLKPTQIYAPNFNTGDRVSLVRYPHGGKFEIPELEVNNRHAPAIELLGPQARNAVGINSKVAERLSGADFDGDTVLVIPNNSGRVKSEPALEGLKNFDPQTQYKAYEGMKPMSASDKQMQMGLVSNLITDMTIKGANSTEIAAAVRHSMVVIDAEKHNLDYRRSAKENNIPALMKKYQGRSQGGADTLISKATSPVRVNARRPRRANEGGFIDPATGKTHYVETGAGYTNKEGKWIPSKEKSTKLAEVDNAHDLSSGYKIERIYADHSNRLKDLANQARKSMVNTPDMVANPSAKKTYAAEAKRLTAALRVAEANAPRERQAQLLANHIVAVKKQDYPGMEKDEIRRIQGQALNEARIRTGAAKDRIVISPREWEAIQAGAISKTSLRSILSNTDLDKVKELATPRSALVMTDAKQARARQMLEQGYPQAEVAATLGVPLSTLKSSVIS